jgi:hypothetical protein
MPDVNNMKSERRYDVMLEDNTPGHKSNKDKNFCMMSNVAKLL